MPIVELNGIRLSYQSDGEGDLVVLVMGTGSPGRVWRMHQVPALRKAGYRVVTVDNRGIPPTDECAEGFTIHDIVADTAALIEHLGGGPAHVIGTSMGARVTQELAVARPDLVRSGVLLAAHARREPLQEAWNRGERALYDEGIELPSQFYAAINAARNLSPKTLQDPIAARDWLDLFELGGSKIGAGVRAQLNLGDIPSDINTYRSITAPCLVVGYGDDRVLPPYLAREVADVIPGARYVEIPDCGHFGFLERPEEVNRVILNFLAEVSLG